MIVCSFCAMDKNLFESILSDVIWVWKLNLMNQKNIYLQAVKQTGSLKQKYTF